LTREWGVEVEISGPDHLLFSLTYADSREAVTLLVAALTALASSFPAGRDDGAFVPRRPPEFAIPRMEITPWEAFFAPSAPRPLRAACGEICAEWIIPYPPGIPVLAPGEAIDGATIDCLEAMVADGATMVGAEDPALRSVQVVVA
jgi:hypothetical protein